jgi:hypothetical protein
MRFLALTCSIGENGGFAFPLRFPLLVQNLPDVALHTLGTFPLHLIGDMPVDVQGEGSGRMTQCALDGLHIVTGSNGCHGVAVPEIVKSGVRATD